MKNNTAGFTLIELLIVIAIIGILAAVLIPNLLGAQKRAYDTAAMSCANSLSKAYATYRVDNPTTAATPAVTEFYKDAAADAEYGAGAPGTPGTGCANTEVNVTGGAATTDGKYNVVVSHKQGRNQYTLTQSGIVTAPKAATTGGSN